MTVNSDSTHQKWMKFAFIVTGSIFLQSYWVSDNVHIDRTYDFFWKVKSWSFYSYPTLLYCVMAHIVPKWKWMKKIWGSSNSNSQCFLPSKEGLTSKNIILTFKKLTKGMPDLKYFTATVFELELPDLDQIWIKVIT